MNYLLMRFANRSFLQDALLQANLLSVRQKFHPSATFQGADEQRIAWPNGFQLAHHTNDNQ